MAASYSGSGVANDIDAIITNITSRMDEIVMRETVTAGMTASQDIIDAFNRSSTAKLATTNTSGLGNYNLVKGYPYGNASLKWENYTLEFDRAICIDIDRKEKIQTDGLMSTARLAANMMRREVVPEIDATRISQAVKKTKAADATHVVSEDVTTSDILSKIGDGIDAVFNDFGVDSGLTIYMNGNLRKTLRSTTEVTKTKSVDQGTHSIDLVTNTIDIDNKIVWVPSFRMGTEYTYLDPDASGNGGGIEKTSSNPDINFLITAPGCVQGVTVISNPKYIDASVNQRKDADSLMYRVYHGVVVEKYSGAAGVYASVATTPSSS